MHFDFEKTQRTAWLVTDRIAFFEKMLPLLNIDEETSEEIKLELSDPNFDYLEVASYMLKTKSEDPDAVLVFDGKKDVYWDIFNIEKSKDIIKKVTACAQDIGKFSHDRGLTQRDWLKRLEALGGF